jgi:DNA-binding beta-propeller fold protein YncE
MARLALLAIFWLALAARLHAESAEQPLLAIEAKIPLGKVSGRIDHLAIDLGRRRLFVAELGNNSVGVVDLGAQKLVATIVGLAEPQGVGYEASTDMLYVANAADGSVRLFQGAELAPSGNIKLGDDADNIRVDAAAHEVFIGYGSGALAVINAANRAKIREIPLRAHPEGFQLAASRSRIFVNLPNARQIAAVDMSAGKVASSWPLSDIAANFPMAVDDGAKRVLVVARSPAKLVAFEMNGGAIIAQTDTCRDADDIFVDSKRSRIYVSCGDGHIDVLEGRGAAYHRIAHIETAPGARTSFFSPDLDRLFLAVRAAMGEPASIWVFRPSP